MYTWLILLSFIVSALSMINLLVMAIQYISASPDGKMECRKVSPQYIFLSASLFTFAGSLSMLSRALASESNFVLVISVILLAISMICSSLMVILRFVSIREAIIAFIANKMPFFTAEANDLIAQLLTEKNKKNVITYSSLLLSFLAEYVIFCQRLESSVIIAMALTFALLALNFANQKILYYRLKHGLYGTCSSEAKEIIAYIVKQLKNKNNSGGSLPKLVFKEEEIAERVLRTDGSEKYAG